MRARFKLLGLVSLPLLAASSLTHAQAYQCNVPKSPPSAPVIERDGPVRRAPVAGYTLAVSWSPEYCRNRETRAGDRFQCAGRNGRFGFVVHGLWPEGRAGAPPQWCSPGQRPSPATLGANLCMTLHPADGA